MPAIDSINPYAEKVTQEIAMLTKDQARHVLNISKDNMIILLEEKLIKCIKTGKSYMIPSFELIRFQHDYLGFDVSTRKLAKEAKEKIKIKERQ